MVKVDRNTAIVHGSAVECKREGGIDDWHVHMSLWLIGINRGVVWPKLPYP